LTQILTNFFPSHHRPTNGKSLLTLDTLYITSSIL
jgi:hypothetical protein